MKEKFLPIGTVLLLKNGTKKIMITGYLPVSKDENKTVYDYSACLFPEGIISVNQTAVFNHDQIAEVIQEGYANEETEKFIGVLKDFLSKNNPDEVVNSSSEESTPQEIQAKEVSQEENKELETLEPPKLDDIDIPVAAANNEEQTSTPEESEVETPSIESPSEAPEIEPPSIESSPEVPAVATPTEAEKEPTVELPKEEQTPVDDSKEVEMPAPASKTPQEPATEPTQTMLVEEQPVDSASIPNSDETTPMGVDAIKPFSE